MGQRVCNRLVVAVESTNVAANDFTLVCSGNNWDVWLIDWRSGAATGLFDPVLAFNNAFREGRSASGRIYPLNYEHLHLIAHSAGSNLISSIAGHLRLEAVTQNSDNLPFMHLSFLDAYHPNAITLRNSNRSFSTLGENADLIDNYIDSRDVGGGFSSLDKTRNIINRATNIEVQNADPAGPITPASLFPNLNDLINQFDRAHDWPRIFYSNSIANTAYPLGFQLSLAAGVQSPLLNNGTTLCVIENLTDTCIPESGISFGLFAENSNRLLAEVTELSAVAHDSINTVVADSSTVSDDELAVSTIIDLPEAEESNDMPDGYVFSRTDVEELRWIAINTDGESGSIWIDRACAESLGGASEFGNWFDLTDRAPAQDTIANPCSAQNPVSTVTDPNGYVFSRSDVDELRWIAQNSDGGIGSIWIDQTCADALGGPTRFGNWFELTEQAPAQDTVASPCNKP